MKKVALLLVFVVLCSVCVFGLDLGGKGTNVADFGGDMTAFKDEVANVALIDYGSFTEDHGYPTAIAMGDYDGDGKDDLAVGLGEIDGSSVDHLYIYDNEGNILEQLGSNWGGGTYVTDLAFGEIDDYPGEELVITRYSISSGSDRVIVYSNHGGKLDYFDKDEGWGQGIYAASVSVGDVDGKSNNDILVGLAHEDQEFDDSSMPKWFVYDSGSDDIYCGGHGNVPDENPYDCLIDPEANWLNSVALNAVDITGYFQHFLLGGSCFAQTCIQFDISNLVLYGLPYSDVASRLPSTFSSIINDISSGEFMNEDIFAVAYADYNFLNFFDMEGNVLEDFQIEFYSEEVFPNAIGFGDFDGDGVQELVVGLDHVTEQGRHDFDSINHDRFYVYDDDGSTMFCASGNTDCTLDISMLQQWDTNYMIVDVAFGDYDGDGYDELAVLKDSRTNSWYVLEYIVEDISLNLDKVDSSIVDLGVAPIFSIEPTEQIPACNDGIDNDGDAGYDFGGGCFDGETIVEYLDCEIDMIRCNDYCKDEYDAYYVKGDPGCTSMTDTTEMNRCGDRMDNDWDFTADFTGGCDVDGDYTLDYVCGCDVNNDDWIDPFIETMQKELCVGKYGCVGLPPLTTNYVIDYALDCETLEGKYLLPDPGCFNMADDSERDEGYQEYRNIEEEMVNPPETGPTGPFVPMKGAAENPDDSLWTRFWQWFGLIA